MPPPKPLYLASACLCGISCRYDGNANPHHRVIDLYQQGLVLAFCPEVDGGLPTPRPPCELRKGRAITHEGHDVTEQFVKGAALALKLALANGIQCAILKERSPSCGVEEVYDGSFSRAIIPGQGITTALLREHGIRVMSGEVFLKESS